MNWTVSSPGVFAQEFGGVEKIYRHVSQAFRPFGREHWGLYCVCCLKLDAQVLSSSDGYSAILRDAWRTLRREFPGLGIVPRGVSQKTYKLPDNESVESWISETFIVQHDKDADAVLASYPARDLPCLYFFPASSQILFLASHWRIDGIGTCLLLNRFFDILSRGVPPIPAASDIWPNDLHRISPTLEDAVGAPKTGDSELESFAQKYIADHHKNAVHAGGLSYIGDATTAPGHPTRVAIMLDKDSTSSLVRACKERNISVTAAVHAALADTVFKAALSDEKQTVPEKYAAVMSVNMRGYLPAPYNSSDYAVGVFVTGVTPTVYRDDSFLQKATKLRAYYRDWYSDQFMQALRITTEKHFDTMFGSHHQKDGPPPKPPSNVTLSSLGIIEKQMARSYSDATQVKVTGFRFGVSVMTRQMLLYVWTFDERLTFSVNYNDAYYSPEVAHGLLESVKSVLEKEMAIQLLTNP
ncbi:hypothetical protein F4680DRAFT_19849 [Xylaria scruposa]|nr:hypothetical protein F4680DRAFT_19849 [Xylaria scruposa]